MTGRAGTRGFGYSIDYDKEIAYDLRLIERHTRYMTIAETFTAADLATFPNGLSVLDYLWHEETRAARWQALTGLELEDLRCMAHDADWEYPGLGAPESPDWYQRGKRAWSAAMKGYGTDDALEVIRSVEHERNQFRLAKAALARHRRNKGKYGRE